MGLITGLLTLPLAPVRGTIWIAELLQREAENQEYDESSILARLAELEAVREQGEFSEEEIEEAENALVERLIELRGVGGQEGYGGFE
ncbi:MAG TPA: gas vesicle protein GvpG [Solirubrobacteraceae bacterium]|jgi:hypothetical protein